MGRTQVALHKHRQLKMQQQRVARTKQRLRCRRVKVRSASYLAATPQKMNMYGALHWPVLIS